MIAYNNSIVKFYEYFISELHCICPFVSFISVGSFFLSKCSDEEQSIPVRNQDEITSLQFVYCKKKKKHQPCTFTESQCQLELGHL